MANALHDRFQRYVHFCQHAYMSMSEQVRTYFFAWNSHFPQYPIYVLDVIRRACPGCENVAAVVICTAYAVPLFPQFQAFVISLKPL